MNMTHLQRVNIEIGFCELVDSERGGLATVCICHEHDSFTKG